MNKSFKFALFNKSFPNPAKFQIRPNFGRSRISAGFVKKAGSGFWPEPEPNSGTALISRQHKMFSKIIERATEQNLHSLAWLDVYCIDMQKAALTVDMTFNTDKTGFHDAINCQIRTY